MRRSIQLTAIALSLSVCFAQSDAHEPLLQWMDQIAQKQLSSREKVIAGIGSRADAELRKKAVRAKILELIGGLPDYKGPLNARVTGSIANPTYTIEKVIAGIGSRADAELRKKAVRAKILELIGGLPDYKGPLNARVTGAIANPTYTIEKVIFESLPHYFVTADLYRPNLPGRYPAVLMSAGHTMLGKVENHVMAANLAAKGFVALAYDPVGLGERMQAFDPIVGKSIAGCCTNEHLHAGAQSILIGESVARYFIFDAMRAIDYLVSRPDVDPDHIGAAGCSGGGCLTTYIAALDPRVKAAAPACFINSLRVLFAGPYPDSEMSLPGFLAAGLDHADFLELVAPMPWLIQATEGDFFTPAGARMVFEEARRWYRLYDAEEKMRFFIGPGPHGTPLETREAMYGWMIRWLKDGKGDAHEQEVPHYTDRDLQVTTSGQVEHEPGSRKLFEVIREEFVARKQPRGIPELLAELRRLEIPSDHRPPVVKTLEESDNSSSRRLRITLDTEAGLEINGVLYVPHASGRKPAVVIIKDRWSSPLVEAAAAKGAVVLELEPRDSQSSYDNRLFLGNWLTNTRANAIGRNLPAMRAHDILRAVDYLSSRDDVDPAAIRATAREVKGIWLLLAAAMDPRIGKIWLDHTPHSFSAAMEGPLNNNILEAIIPGFLLHWDLQDLVQAIGPRPVLWTDPANWMGQIIPLGAGFRYRYSEQTDDAFLAELLR